MTTYISILRGINVSGQKKIKMVELKKLYESMGFKNIQTYIQSGNVVFECSDHDVAKISTTISSGIKDHFGFEVPIIIRTKEEIKKVIEDLPFENKEIEKLCVTFLHSTPTQTPIKEINEIKDETEEFFISGKEIYLYLPISIARTKLTNNFFERKLKVIATSRNWKTVNKLLEIAESNL